MSAFSARNPRADMSNVIALDVRQARRSDPHRLARHAAYFSGERRSPDDVFWLKENAEFLNILEVSDLDAPGVLDVYAAFYEGIDTRLGAHPQYYRFLLSICLDIEDLGLNDGKGAAMCDWVWTQGLPEAELSDLQRAEALRLLARRGIGLPDAGLTARLHRFIDRCETFCVPNKKAAYELTHIVFYLSEYGRRDPGLSARAIQSLTFAGLLAYLDQNHDLLAEICIALRYAGQTPSPIWEGSVAAALRGARDEAPVERTGFDDYHCYAVASWLAGMTGATPFPLAVARPGPITMPAPAARPLRAMSYALDANRSSAWFTARGQLLPRLDPADRTLLEAAEQSTGYFDAFYAGFARLARPCRVSS